ncbi:MAG: PQQ-binding-like beta-propeller repeat protein [Lachnospiraceae bacterium]|nr:PQQ-binding-like beta-propeller repeat protein [Lachnospiraceae bacterium]
MKKRRGIIIAAVCVLFLLVCVGALLFLKKIRAAGGLRYLYNLEHDTVGLVSTEYFPEGLAYATGNPKSTALTAPSVLGITEILRFEAGGKVEVAEGSEGFVREETISFSGDLITGTVKGLFTFRGNYHRTGSSYGTATVEKEQFSEEYWTFATGKLLKSSGTSYWSGNGWTGQPLIIRWPEETKQIMNLYPEKKEKENFTEVIYSGMDGYVHFLDLEDGSESRDPIHIGMVFKGTASLHPSGIPMLVLGSGDAQTGLYGENVSPRAYIYSLIDGTKLYEFGANDDLAPRTFHAYDSSPIIHAETDTLIYPGENGVLYTVKLNTKYDEKAGTLSIAPSDPVDYTYSTARATEEAFTWGMENSASVYGNYLYVGDNGGVFYCLDLNTMSMVWAQDVYGDVNSSPIFSEEAEGNFVYLATTLTEAMLDEHSMGEVAIYKLNAATGAVVWKKTFACHNVDGVEGGILATGVLGKGAIEGQIIYSVSRTPKLSSGYLVSIDIKNGETVWMQELDKYAWSSTATMYAENGAVYLIQCCSDGTVLLFNAANGYLLDSVALNTTLEATPAVFENTIVVGTRDERIVGLTVE